MKTIYYSSARPRYGDSPYPRWIDDWEYWKKMGDLPSGNARRISIINFKPSWLFQGALEKTSTRTNDWKHKHENNSKVKWFRLDKVDH